MTPTPAARFSVAPMMDWTDRHCRVFHRLLTRRATLYTEMVTAPAVIHGDRDRLLGFAPEEHPVVLQLGGSDPAELARAAAIAADYGYDGIDLNCGCPSDRVQSGRFGACLMAEPDLVAACVAAMRAAVALPISVKCRIGIDDADPREQLPRLVEAVVAAGVATVTIHARKAWLSGLSPKENRSVPPLDYDLVFEIKRRWPDLPITINGGIRDLDGAEALLAPRGSVRLDGVMLGRAAYETPEILAGVDRRIYGEAVADVDSFAVMERLEPYCAALIADGGRLSHVTRHILGLFAGRPGARAFRRILTEGAIVPGAGLEVLRAATAAVRRPAREVEDSASGALASDAAA
ncbi:tRNA dihydrouridine(20/20a) synthase DusA [Siculibacillus lacustris]|uniref:tRNA-dihydrouridine(20/20a) synthase n=1 Tax=Siculibacillus lacustris TaxID=1549641 RepID=A0A4Q9VXD4_9HYPH|nr:tRNA dihydrouridine(20/20a) synthase DusA [Siculibacillus lacustris]TBW40941.1 tRNA dihydrouridine(20/20a) synthase DusA [Siculibacillus lacustris]